MESSQLAIVASTFNKEITDALVKGARYFLESKNQPARLIQVAGAFEIPLAASAAISAGAQGIIALGCVIKGETEHFDYVCRGCTDGIMRVMLDSGVPVSFGVLMTNTLHQAQQRASLQHLTTSSHTDNITQSNKGYEAAQTLLDTLTTLRKLSQ